jgi:hypothetical protein
MAFVGSEQEASSARKKGPTSLRRRRRDRPTRPRHVDLCCLCPTPSSKTLSSIRGVASYAMLLSRLSTAALIRLLEVAGEGSLFDVELPASSGSLKQARISAT